MNRFLEMIQKGEDLIARTNELLNNEIDLATSGSVDIATYLTDLKAIHAESLEFTNPDVAESLEQYREGMENDEYMDYLTQYLTIRGKIMGELRDRVYDRTAKVDMAFNAKTSEYMNLNREISSLKADIEAINKDIEQLDKSITILTNANQTDAVTALETAKNNMLARIREKEARIEEIKREQEVLLHGGVVAPREIEHENEDEHEAERTPLPQEDQDEVEDEVERAPLPQEDEDDVAEDDEEQDEEQEHGPGFVPVFPELGDGEEEDTPDAEEEDDEELAPLPEEDDEEAASDDDAEDEEEDEEEEDEELAPVPEDDEEIEVIHHTDAKPTLLRRIGNVVYAVITFLGSLAAVTVTVDHFQNHHDMTPALEEESQLGDEDDLEDNPAPDDEQDDQDNDNDQDEDLTQTPDDQTPDDQTPSDQTPSEDDDKDEDKDQDTDKDDEQEEDQEDELGSLPAELAPGEYIYDRETGLEVTSTGDAYVHTGDITLNDGDRDLTATDHGTVIVGAEDMQTDQKLPELTGEELTYEEVTEDMSAQEISDLDAALAEWAAQFDQGLTLKP